MRHNRIMVMVAFLAAVIGAALYSRGVGRTVAQGPLQVGWSRPAAHLVLKIDGMDCVMCAAGLQNTLRASPGVRRAEVSYRDKRAVPDYDPATVDAARLEKVIADSGFKVAPPVPARP